MELLVLEMLGKFDLALESVQLDSELIGCYGVWSYST